MISYTMSALAEVGVTLSGRPILTDQGILRINDVDWKKSTPLVNKWINDKLFDCSGLLNGT